MGYYVGDIPATDLVIEPARAGEPINLTPFDQAEATLRDESGLLVTTLGFTVTIDRVGLQLVIEWPGQSPFAVAGLYSLHLVLDSAAGPRERLAPIYLVAQAFDGWHNLDTAREDWPDAPLHDAWLYELLWVAKDNCTAYAPPLVAGAWPPLNYRRAQLMQARNLWNVAKVDPGSGGMGDEGFVIRPFPLDWMIRQVLRPKTAVPKVG